MSIFNRRTFSKETLSVSKPEVMSEYRKKTDDELKGIIGSKFSLNTRLSPDRKFEFLYLFKEVPLTRKQSLMFLEKLTNSGQMIAYAYRHLVRCAYHYGVPKIVIENYIESKEDYEDSGKGWGKTSKDINLKILMQKNAKTLISATNEMIYRSKSRKSKLNNIIDKIVDKEN